MRNLKNISAITIATFSLISFANFANAQPAFDPLDDLISNAKKEININELEKQSKEGFMNTPEAKKYSNGNWEFYQGVPNSPKGEYCTAMFSRKGYMLTIVGPGGDYKGALMNFYDLQYDKIPQPANYQNLLVTLKQGNDAPATLKAINYKKDLPDGTSIGVVTFTVPSIGAAMEGMEDNTNFEISSNGKIIAQIEWTGGHNAREELKKCLGNKR